MCVYVYMCVCVCVYVFARVCVYADISHVVHDLAALVQVRVPARDPPGHVRHYSLTRTRTQYEICSCHVIHEACMK